MKKLIIITLLICIGIALASDPNDISITPNPDGTITVEITVSRLQAKAMQYNGINAVKFKAMIGRMLDRQVAIAVEKHTQSMTDEQKEQILE